LGFGDQVAGVRIEGVGCSLLPPGTGDVVFRRLTLTRPNHVTPITFRVFPKISPNKLSGKRGGERMALADLTLECLSKNNPQYFSGNTPQ